MNYSVGDIVQMKKSHPCGANEWEVLRVGADFKLRCKSCQHLIMIPREKFEKSVKKILVTHSSEN
ncbi:MAG: DUF951 domain-containing protein [Cellulosilyticaceae bacterium]